jgi:tetratricopeptide (TPR) repeat protein
VEIDGYHACPCHSEKKIKFCCGKDIVHDLNLLLAKQAAGQELAALDECERAIRKHGPKDCLLTMKTQLLLEHDEVDKALEVNAQFRQKNPQHPAGYHQLALLRLEKRDVAGAVDALQDAVDAVRGNEIPVFLTTGFRTVGFALLMTGFPFAARAHFRFALELNAEQDEELKKLYLQTFLSPRLSVSHRFQWELAKLTEAESQEDWGRKIITAGRGIARGQFRKSLKYLELASESFPDNEHLLFSLAVLSMNLNDKSKSYQAWKRYSEVPELDEAKAVQAKLMTILFCPDELINRFSQVASTMEVSDFNAVFGQALSNDRLQALDRSEWNEDDDSGPPPRNIFALLDQPYPKEQPLTVQNTPIVTGYVLLYGKQSDRNARMVLEFRDIPENRHAVLAFQNEFSQWQLGQPVEETVGSLTVPYGIKFPNWSIAPEMPPVDKSDLLHQLIMDEIQRWTNTPVPMLDGNTPREAAKDPHWDRVLKAILISLQYDNLSLQISDAEFEAIWDDLELARPIVTNYQNRAASDFCPVELIFLPLEKLGEEFLTTVAVKAYSYQMRPLMRRTWREILNRPDNENVFPKFECLHQLALFSTSIPEALELFAQARAKVSQAGVPLGNYLVDEFEYRLGRGITEKLDELLSIIYQSHIQEPQVAERMGMVLQDYGLSVVPNATNSARSRSSENAKASPMFVTPSESSPASSGSSKLWLPD